jgi:hypothetical protein
MYRWRIILFGLLLLSIIAGAATAIVNFDPLIPVHSQPRWMEQRFESDRYEIPTLVSMLGGLTSLYVFGILLLYLIPDRIQVLSTTLKARPLSILRLIGVGLLGLLLIGILIAGASLAVTTFPLAILVILVLILSSTGGGLALAFQVGRGLLRRSGWLNSSPFVELIVGILILYPVVYIPIVGAVLLLLYTCLGLGLNIITRFGSNQPWSIKPLMERGNS